MQIHRVRAKRKQGRNNRATAGELLNSSDTESQAPTYMIGIGASAGGLEALTALITQLPDRLPATIFIAQHLSPTHRSMLAELLSRATSLAVSPAVDGDQPQAGHIYVGTPGFDLLVVDGTIRLVGHEAPGRPHPSADRLFDSLAAYYGPNAIGVVLSGTGSDGSAGIRKIKAAGGRIFAQDLESARYPGMPQAAMQTGVVDVQGPPTLLAEALHQQVVNGQPLTPSVDPSLPALAQLFARLKERSGVDFSEYKEASISRRLERRIQATSSVTLEKYLTLVEQSPTELDRLYKELLISVTSFFRDPKALESLDGFLNGTIAEKQADQEIRVWVAGCATGEEAYTIAILLAEGLRKANRSNKIRIFASDIDNAALAVARKGRYPSSAIAGLDPDLIQMYFVPDNTGWFVSPILRDTVTFCYHDMNRDPPFVRMDLISCRNVLIYFNVELQRRVLERFHSALNDNGLLFLGRSETVHHQENLFAEIDRQAHLYRATLVARRYRLPSASAWAPSEIPEPKAPEIINQIARERLTPGVLLSADLDVEYSHGDVSGFLRLGSGKTSFNVLALLDRRYRGEAQALLHHGRQECAEAQGRDWPLGDDADSQVMRMVVKPLVAGHKQWIFLGFETRTRTVPLPQQTLAEPAEPHVRALEAELTRMREHQQVVIEELETSNEELQSLNEEMHATNEELETTNEELHATNEELTTVNEELETKSQELREANLDLENLHHSIRYGVVVVDRRLKILRVNNAAMRLFPILANEESGLELFSRLVDLSDLHERIARVLTGENAPEQTVHAGERWYFLRLHPIVVGLDNCTGVMLTLVDQTDLILATRTLQESQAQLLTVMNHSTALFSVRDKLGRYQFANHAFLDMFGLTAADVLGRNNKEIFPPSTAAVMNTGDVECFTYGDQIDAEEIVQTPTGNKTLLTTRFSLQSADNLPHAICTQAIDITERQQAELRAKAQFDLHKAVLDSIPATVAVLDTHGTIISTNAAWRRFAEDNNEQDASTLGIGCNYLDVCDKAQLQDAEPSARRARHLLMNTLEGKENRTDYVKYPCHSKQEQRWFMMYASPLRHPLGGAVVSHMNVTPWQLAEQRSRLSAAVVDNANEGVCVLNAARQILMVNKALVNITGLKSNKLIGQRWRALRIDKLIETRPSEVIRRLRTAGVWRGEVLLKRGRGNNYPVWISVSCIRDEDDNRISHFVLLISDISKLRKAEASLLELAYHDPLTGLSNRTLLMERMQHALAHSTRRQKPMAVLFLDLDRFKLINDSLGHEIGDELLRVAAQRILETVRRSDLVARLGGDEFVVVLEELRHAEDAAITAEKIIAVLEYPFNISGHEVFISGSIGITLYPDDADSVNGLLKNADAAMYRAKELGRGRHQFFKAELYQRSQRRLWLESELRRALDRHELILHHQPQYHMSTGRLRGIESLLRWQHGSEGMILPDEFVPVAEESGLIERIGTWVLQQACDEFKALRATGISVDIFSVNVSAHQLRENGFAARVADLLARAEVAPACLELELTESALVEHQEVASQVLHELRKIGVRVALDDFGTGYSSLSYLQRYPISTLKIDRSFVRDIPTDNNDAAIVQAILAMAKVLQLDVVAEGVEAREQLDNLMSWGCDFMQGFLASKAVPLAELPDTLSSAYLPAGLPH